MSGGAAQLDTLVERCVGWDAVHVQELECTHSESQRDRFGEALIGTGEKFCQAGVECDLPAQNAHDEGRCEVAIFRGESVSTG
jgi:hypothetical protein